MDQVTDKQVNMQVFKPWTNSKLHLLWSFCEVFFLFELGRCEAGGLWCGGPKDAGSKPSSGAQSREPYVIMEYFMPTRNSLTFFLVLFVLPQ